MSGKGFVDIVYSTGSKMLRSVHMNCTAVLSNGESKITVTGDDYNQSGGAEAILKKQLNLVSLPDPTCAVLDGTDTVVSLINADAAVDKVSGLSLVNTTSAAKVGMKKGVLPAPVGAVSLPVTPVQDV